MSFAARLLFPSNRKNIPSVQSERVEEILYKKVTDSENHTTSRRVFKEDNKKKKREVFLENEEQRVDITYRNMRRMIREKINVNDKQGFIS